MSRLGRSATTLALLLAAVLLGGLPAHAVAAQSSATPDGITYGHDDGPPRVAARTASDVADTASAARACGVSSGHLEPAAHSGVAAEGAGAALPKLTGTIADSFEGGAYTTAPQTPRICVPDPYALMS